MGRKTPVAAAPARMATPAVPAGAVALREIATAGASIGRDTNDGLHNE